MVNVAGRATLIAGGEGFDLAELSGGQLPSDPMVVIERYWAAATALARCLPLGAGRPVPEGELQSPVPSTPSIFGFVANL
jgi:hypothetical protein